jgi:hypothetical protein
MIRPPSLQRSWDAFVTSDSAIIPAPKRDDAASDEEHKTALEAWIAKIRAARETADWKPVIVEGQSPTKFVMGQVDRNIWRSVMDRAVLSPDSPRHIGQIALNALLFRLSVREVPEFKKFERTPDASWDMWVMAPASLVNELDEVDPSIVGELGSEVLRRLQGIDSKR